VFGSSEEKDEISRIGQHMKRAAMGSLLFYLNQFFKGKIIC